MGESESYISHIVIHGSVANEMVCDLDGPVLIPIQDYVT